MLFLDVTGRAPDFFSAVRQRGAIMEIILASASPRRRELLSRLYPDFRVVVADIDESLDGDISPRERVERLSVMKGRAVLDGRSSCRDAVIISSDTLVEIDGEPLGKPTSEEDAVRMLSRLSGREHNVHTGVAVHYRGRVLSGADTTHVYFRALSAEEIIEYVEGGEPMDKAGSYGIQGEGGKFVLKIDGDFDTVMGLSVKLVKRLVDLIIGDFDE